MRNQWLSQIQKGLKRHRLGLLISLGLLVLSVVVLPPTVAFTPTNSTVVQSESLEQQGRRLYEAEQFSEAVTAWQRSLDGSKASNNPAQQAMILSNLSLAYQQLGQWQQASQAIAASIRLIQSSSLTANLLAQTLDVQGRLEFAQGHTQSALTAWQQAAEIYSQQNSPILLTRNHINQAQALQALGLYRQARSLLTETTQTLQKEPNTALKAIGLRSLGNVLRMTGDLDQSRQVLEQSLRVAQGAADSAVIDNALLDLGNTVRLQKDSQTALKYYQQAATSTSSSTRIQALLNQLSVLIEQQQFSQAESLLPQIQAQIEQLPLNRSTVYANINFAQSLVKLNNRNSEIAARREPPPAIVQRLEKAVQQAKALGDLRTESSAIGTLGTLYETAQQWSQAREFTQQALFKAQAIQASEIAYRWQWQLGRLLNQQGEISGAIAAYDVALQTLQSLRYDLVAMNPDVQFSFREAVEPVYREFVELLLRSRSGSKAEVPQANLLKAREVIESLQLAEVNNFLREACLEDKQQIDRVIDQADRSAAAIYPIILADRLEVILKLPQQPLRHHTIAIPQQTVNKVLDELRQNLRKPHTVRTVQSLSGQVYDWLIRPIAADLATSQVKTLVFVLDGNLRTIPMSVLYDGQQYLVEQYSLALTPGLQLIAPKPLKQLNLKALAAGVSDAQPPQFSGLPNVLLELKEIQSAVSGRVLLNQQFTTQNLQNQVDSQPFSIVHLATHGQFSADVEQTFILAWDKPMKVNDLSRLLRSKDNQGTEAIELLVLSACQTAIGDKRAALGIAGVAVRAGARSTIASLWNVNDASTAALMHQFYQVLSSNQGTKAEALRQAQLALLKHPKYQRPMFWAPYILVGNWL
jgi:CHAT domain-containing protein/lipopolysaccharide biosynthesis regulator YciM